MTIESEIQTEVEALKGRFAETKALYREVCALLFFRYGITPTASKLYQLVRKGSMSAPADALAKFWDELRSKARVEIDHPDLPPALRDTAASAIAGIWQQATAVARGELAALRLEVQEQLDASRAELASEHRLVADRDEQLKVARGQVAAVNTAISQARDELEAERRAHAGAVARVQELQRQLTEQQAQQEAARAAFSADLAKAREAVDVANARADASDRRALMEIEQERQARARADKQAEALRAQLGQLEGRARDDAQAAAEALARLQSKAEGLEQATQELRAAAGQAGIDLAALRAQLATAQGDVARYKAEADTLRSVLTQIRPPDNPPSAPRATKQRR
jgi:chromosome segregation ATPase